MVRVRCGVVPLGGEMAHSAAEGGKNDECCDVVCMTVPSRLKVTRPTYGMPSLGEGTKVS